MSRCGNFGFLGFEEGGIEKFNMQSGRLRGNASKHTVREKLHAGAVTGLASDGLNRSLISASEDGTLKVWDFFSMQLARTLRTGSPVTHMTLCRESNLVAYVDERRTVRLVDFASFREVRRWEVATKAEVTATCFSSDGACLAISSRDCFVRVWDLLTGSLIDWVALESAVLSMDFAPTGEYLATCQEGRKGIYLWSIKSFHGNATIESVPRAPFRLELPAFADRMRKVSHKDFYAEEHHTAEEDG